MSQLFPRPLYIDLIKPFIGKPEVKVLAGIRRCGKSVLLRLIADHIGRDNHSAKLIHLNFESFRWKHITDSKSLYDEIVNQINTLQPQSNEVEAGADVRPIVLLDEVQLVADWEDAVNALMVDYDADIYVTGSNSRMLSSELSTMLTGRYVSFSIYTLSFAEYLSFHGLPTSMEQTELQTHFMTYLKTGGFPILSTSDYNPASAYRIITDIYSSVILRDVVQRHNIRNIDMLERIVRFVFDNTGNRLNAKNIADYFKSQQRNADINTVYNYLGALVGAFILHRVQRFDIRGKAILSTNEKYYVADTGLVYAMFGYHEHLISGMLENLVYIELKRRGYDVYIGQIGDKEVDFVAIRRECRIYVQVCYRLGSPETIAREFNVLQSIPDQYQKFVVSMEPDFADNINGVCHRYLPSFLISNEI